MKVIVHSMTRARQSELANAHILDLTHQLRDAKIQRNALTAISSLPDELLSRIMFEYAVEMDIFSNRWFGILVVCHRWYEVASSHAQLWSFVDATYKGVETWDRINRSKGYPLTCVFKSIHNGSAVHDVLQEHGRRVRSLTFSASNSEEVQLALKDIDSLPILETLSVRWWGEESYTLPVFVLHGGAPLLRNIRLDGLNFSDWGSLSNLTELTLDQFPDDCPKPTMDELLFALERSPRLRCLKLLSCFPLSPHTTILGPIALPCLECIELSGFLDPLNTFFRSIALPATTAMRITLFDCPEPRTLSKLLVPIRLHLHKSEAPTLRSLHISGDFHYNFVIVADTAVPARSPLALENPKFVLVVHPQSQGIARKVFTRVLDALPLESATYLDLSLFEHSDRRPTSKTLCVVFQHIPRAEVVRVKVNEGMLTIVEGLTDAVRRGKRGRWGAKRRLAAKGIRWPNQLQLQDSISGGMSVGAMLQKDRRLSELETLFSEYKAMDVLFKPSGVPWGTLDWTHVQDSLFVWRHVEELYPLVGKLLVNGKSWNPVSWKKTSKEDRKQIAAKHDLLILSED
ncbi:hypothetical protein FA95DRAFT_1574893 [Auriscalpium vulgare]|uniref:Uncharacterized protein n=1 Tax=Auriscalpium vulgare TaxID=40419 RepID=A0ACB8RIQ1_9AGAM|nr:hypothetical protein FA95DRAFT_1574893 [Auriscalpium vulgare]